MGGGQIIIRKVLSWTIAGAILGKCYAPGMSLFVYFKQRAFVSTHLFNQKLELESQIIKKKFDFVELVLIVHKHEILLEIYATGHKQSKLNLPFKINLLLSSKERIIIV